MDSGSWETIMTRVYKDWDLTVARAHVLDAYTHTPDNLATSLHAAEAIDNETAFAARARAVMWQPDIAPRNSWFFYHGGKHANKYLVTGCISCQRATTIYYDGNFHHRLDAYWP